MVENNLCQALRGLVKEAVKDLLLPTQPKTPRGEPGLREPQVVNNYLPPKRSGDADDFPFVLVRAERGSSNQDQTSVTVVLVVGVYCQNGLDGAREGHEHCLNVMERIRLKLMSLPGLILDGRYQLRGDVTWSLPAEQPFPYYQLDMETHWTFRSPIQVSGVVGY